MIIFERFHLEYKELSWNSKDGSYQSVYDFFHTNTNAIIRVRVRFIIFEEEC